VSRKSGLKGELIKIHSLNWKLLRRAFAARPSFFPYSVFSLRSADNWKTFAGRRRTGRIFFFFPSISILGLYWVQGQSKKWIRFGIVWAWTSVSIALRYFLFFFFSTFQCVRIGFSYGSHGSSFIDIYVSNFFVIIKEAKQVDNNKTRVSLSRNSFHIS